MKSYEHSENYKSFQEKPNTLHSSLFSEFQHFEIIGQQWLQSLQCVCSRTAAAAAAGCAPGALVGWGCPLLAHHGTFGRSSSWLGL